MKEAINAKAAKTSTAVMDKKDNVAQQRAFLIPTMLRSNERFLSRQCCAATSVSYPGNVAQQRAFLIPAMLRSNEPARRRRAKKKDSAFTFEPDK